MLLHNHGRYRKHPSSAQKRQIPGFSRDIVSFGLVREIEQTGDEVQVGIEITTGDPAIPEQIAADIKTAIGTLDGVKDVKVRMEISQPKQQPSPNYDAAKQASNSQAMQEVKYAIAIASGKGGVGKSTVTVNLACALQKSAGG